MEIGAVSEPNPTGPQWIERSSVFKTGGDPLGIQTITQDRVIGRLLPGILALSERARYFSFYAYLLQRYEDLRRTPTNRALQNYVRARDYEYALAVRLCPNHCGSSAVGANNASRATATHPASYERGISVDSDGGGYGLYYGSPMTRLGIVAPAGTLMGEVPTPVDVVRRPGRAIALAQAFGQAIADTRYVTEGFIDNDEPIPEDVLVDYASKACLCRLVDFPQERDLLRQVLLEPDSSVDPAEVRARREGIALFLDLLSRDKDVGTSDEDLRRATWRAFVETPRITGAAYTRTLSRWAVVAAGHWAQMALMIVWRNAGPALLNRDTGAGLTHEELASAINELASAKVRVGESEIDVHAGRLTRDLDEELRLGFLPADLPSLVGDPRAATSAVAGICHMLLVRAALPEAEASGPDWGEFGRIDGEWQPGLIRMMALFDLHLADNPTVAESLAWLLNHFVIRTHERIAYSKLPEFTFRFRWEMGSLRFYGHPFSWTDPGNIRARTLKSLTKDIEFWQPADGQPVLTPDGVALVARAFGE
jgi:hypothetical protein